MQQNPTAHSSPDGIKPPQLYCDHATSVRDGAEWRASGITPYVTTSLEWKNTLNSLTVAAEWHDLGKLDPDTQLALNTGRSSNLPHDHIDAGVAYVTHSTNSDWQAGWLIRAHHAPGLPSVVKENLREGDTLRGKRKPVDDPEYHRDLIERNNLQLSELVSTHRKEIPDSVTPNKSTPSHGLTTRLALSCLVDADHTDTANYDADDTSSCETVDPRWSERLETLESYIKELQTAETELTDRNKARQQLFNHCSTIDINSDKHPVVTCEASVGLGKTTAVLSFLLKKAIEKKLRRLVIVAPYTAILTQTAKTLRKALLLPNEVRDEVILEHHHRAEFTDPVLKNASVIWNAPIILTTSVQFFETLGSNNPTKLRKLHRLPGSAIFIDEAHAALPIALWPQCFDWLQELSKHWGCTTALVSGSLIKFWEHEWGQGSSSRTHSIPEISPSSLVEYSKQFETKRVTPQKLDKPSSVKDLKKIILDRLKNNRSQLIIFNTTHSAAGFAKHLLDSLGKKKFDLSSSTVLHLSTALTPTDREAILQEIESRMQDPNQPAWVLVATSCVEAGVDLDFADGFREECSVCSFIQTSGRINRHGKFEKSTLTSFSIASDPLLRPHPQFEKSAEVFRGLFPELISPDYSLSEIATAAQQRELEKTALVSPGSKLSDLEKAHDYPEVAEACKVIKTDTCTVLVNESIKERIVVGEPVNFRDILANSVQVWAEKINQLGFETINSSRTATELFFASSASYDPLFLGIMKAQLQSSETIL